MPDPARRRRDSARVVVLDAAGRVLLFETLDDHNGVRFWITPGGGLEAGESLRATARRELHEETGHLCADDELVGPVAVSRGEWQFRGTPLVGEDWYFACTLDGLVVDRAGWTPLEHELHVATRWWHPDELDATDEIVVPGGLGGLARALARGRVPATPLVLPWVAV